MSGNRRLHAEGLRGGPLCRPGSGWRRGHFAVVADNRRVTCASCRARLLEGAAVVTAPPFDELGRVTPWPQDAWQRAWVICDDVPDAHRAQFWQAVVDTSRVMGRNPARVAEEFVGLLSAYASPPWPTGGTAPA